MAEWILALLQEHSMCSNISKAACSRSSNVPAWTQSDLTASIRDSVTALSWQHPSGGHSLDRRALNVAFLAARFFTPH